MAVRRKFLQASVSAATAMTLPSISWAFQAPGAVVNQRTQDGNRETSEVESFTTGSRMKIIGVGGCGCNVVENMIQHGVKGIEFIRADTFTPSMLTNPAHRMIQLRPLGRQDGEDPEYAFKDASDVEEDIRHAIHGTRMLFITVGMAGSTGAGAAPVIARISRQMGIVTVGVAITPFAFEGRRRWRRTEKWMDELEKNVDSLLVVPNERMANFLDDDCSMKDAFAFANDFVMNVVGGFAETINVSTHVNLEFEDACDVVGSPYKLAVGSAMASGTHRARNAVELAISSPMLDGVDIFDAKRVLILISSAKKSLKLSECKRAINTIRAYVQNDSVVYHGTTYDEKLGDQMRVTVIAATDRVQNSINRFR